MSELLRQIMQAVFGVRYVQIVMHDGRRQISRTWWRGGRLTASPHGSPGIGACILLDDGKVIGPSYVDRWLPYDALAARTLPRAPTHTTQGEQG